MASIKDAIEESLQDNNAFVKYILYTIPLFICVSGYDESNNLSLTILVYIMLFGFLLTCTRNVKQGKNIVLPSLNIFAVFWTGLKGVIALLPIGLLAYTAGIYLSNISKGIFPEGNLEKCIFWIITAISSSILYTGYILYSKNFKVKDAYNFKLISRYCGDILFGFVIMILKLGIANLIICLPIGYLMFLFIGIDSLAAKFIWSLIAMVNLSVIGHYTAQMDYETIIVKENEDKII